MQKPSAIGKITTSISYCYHLFCFLVCDRNMGDRLGNLLSPDRNNETEESKCCKQLYFEALTLRIYSELTERMVSLDFDSDWISKTKT